MQCPKCGTENLPKAKFCKECGFNFFKKDFVLTKRKIIYISTFVMVIILLLVGYTFLFNRWLLYRYKFHFLPRNIINQLNTNYPGWAPANLEDDQKMFFKTHVEKNNPFLISGDFN